MRDSGTVEPRQDAEDRLIDECQRGNLSAFERLYEIHGVRMKSLAFHLLGDVSDAEDAVQEAFLKIYRNLQRFQRQSALSTWIYRILVNTCHDLGRKRGRRREREEILVPVSSPSERSSVALRLALEKSLEALEERPRTVFLLHEVEGLKHAEIAAILDIPEGTSKHLLYTAKRELQERLKDRLPLTRSRP